ncbi:MAG: hemerythrin family protein [Oscillospiraceae bacterium]
MAYQLTQDMLTGNKAIDDQHKLLFDAINGLLDACSKGMGRKKIEEVTNFLYEYTARHFADEEKLQIKYSYPDYENHKRYHETYKKTVRALMNQLAEEGPTVALVGKVNTSVAEWLINHIRREDVKLAAHIRSVAK